MDIAYHVCARRFSYAPPDARSAFRRLAAAGLLGPDLTARALGMVGFRNVVVHGYDRVGDEQVHAMMCDELGDLEAVLRALETAAGLRGPDAADAGDADAGPAPG